MRTRACRPTEDHCLSDAFNERFIVPDPRTPRLERGAHRLSEAEATELLTQISLFPELHGVYQAPNSRKHPYPLWDHTMMLIRFHERAFGTISTPSPLSFFDFQLFLLLHDIGKPSARRLGDKDLQHQETIRLLALIRRRLPIDDFTMNVFKALVSDDALGLYLRGKIDETSAQGRLERQLSFARGLARADFFRILTAYFQCDSGAYTRFVFDLQEPFVEKASLEHFFAWSSGGAPVQVPEEGRVLMNPHAEAEFQRLRTEFVDGSSRIER